MIPNVDRELVMLAASLAALCLLLVLLALVLDARRSARSNEASLRNRANEAVALLRLLALPRSVPPAPTLLAVEYTPEIPGADPVHVEVLLVCDDGGRARLAPQMPIRVTRVRVVAPDDAVLLTITVGRTMVSEYMLDLRELRRSVAVPVGCYFDCQTGRAERRARA